MTDWGRLYADHVDAVASLVLGLDGDVLRRPVPATPAWEVGDVLRHLAGGAADHVTGRTEGAPGPEWTARHVSERAALTAADLVDELRGNTAGVVHLVVDDPRPAIVWDIAVHHADLREALGLPPADEALWAPVLAAAGEVRLGTAGATIRTGSAELGAGGPTVDVSPYELFRALFSRRSRAQIAAWAGDALDAGEVGIFGPRDDDQPPAPAAS